MGPCWQPAPPDLMTPPREIKAIDVPSGAILAEQQPMEVQDTAIELVVPAEAPVQEVAASAPSLKATVTDEQTESPSVLCGMGAQNVCAT